MQVFPLPAGAHYDYASRFSTKPGGHKGTDIFAERGTAVVAVVDGLAYRADNPKGGKCVYLTGGDFGKMESFYYAHLDWVDPVLPDLTAKRSGGTPINVKAGQVIGHVGTTGNAVGTAPHLHFQMRKRLAASMVLVNPYEYLRQVDPHLHRGPVEPPRVEPGSEPGTGTRASAPSDRPRRGDVPYPRGTRGRPTTPGAYSWAGLGVVALLAIAWLLRETR